MMTTDRNYDIDEIRKMISSIRGEDRVARLNSLSNLHLIAQVLGPERTRTELIPYTVETTDHNSADLCRIAQELGKMLDDVGGSPHVKILLQALHSLCENEDVLIREPATDSIVQIGKLLSASDYGEMAAFICSLCEDTWYPLKCAGCTIACELYSQLPDDIVPTINQFLCSLASDHTVMVRRSLAKAIPALIKSTRKSAQQVVVSILKTLSADESAAVAIEIPASVALISSVSPDIAYTCSEKLYKSELWQARSVLITYIDQIFAKDHPKDFLKNIVNSATIDPINVIRASIARQIAFVHLSGCLTFEEFQQFVYGLISDSETCVRLAVATSLGSLPKTKSDFDDNSLSTLLNDEELDVRLEALKSVAATGKSIKSAAKNLSDLIKFSNWRVKKGVANLLPKIAKMLDAAKFNADMLPIVKALLSDESSEVRHEIAVELTQLIARYGAKWQKDGLFPIVKELFESDDYQMRKTAIEAINLMKATDQLADILEAAANDPVPNVRMVLARNLPRGHKLLEKLMKDADIDVSDYASQQ